MSDVCIPFVPPARQFFSGHVVGALRTTRVIGNFQVLLSLDV